MLSTTLAKGLATSSVQTEDLAYKSYNRTVGKLLITKPFVLVLLYRLKVFPKQLLSWVSE